MQDDLTRLVESARCLVFVGPGGVGKTSTAGAVALECARSGRRSVVLTIDPARRLANALGLPEVGSVEHRIASETFSDIGLAPPRAGLSAMMLDIKEAWDGVVERHHPDPASRARLLEHPMYHALSTALAGSQEYMAMEKLYQLAQRNEDRLDRIVLDTPPANHAVDFLEAPSRIMGALGNDATRWLLDAFNEGARGRRLFDAGSGFFVRTIGKLTGMELLQQLAELLKGFQAMLGGFKERAEAVQALLSSDETRFVVVSSPDREGVELADAFAERLLGRKARLSAIILNRGPLAVESKLEAPPEGLGAELKRLGAEEDLAGRLHRAMRAEAHAYAVARDLAGGLRSRWGVPVFLIPELSRDVADLSGLDALRAHMAS